MSHKKKGRISDIRGRLLIPGGMRNDTWVELLAVAGEPDGAWIEVAKELRQDVERLRQLQRLLREEAPAGKSFGELAEQWLKRVAKRRANPYHDRRHVEHMRPLAELREGELTMGAIEDLFGDLLSTGALGPPTINKLRGAGAQIIKAAQGNQLWRGANPFQLVGRMKQRKPVYSTMTLAELLQVFGHLRQDRYWLAKTCLLTGMRPGEALGLRKVDVDLAKKMMLVRRSHGRNETKTKTERRFPIHNELVKDLRAAIDSTESEYVFPAKDGERQSENTKLAYILSTAISAAGLVDGFRYMCRRSSCGRAEELRRPPRDDGARCPDCEMKLWVEPKAKEFRFYDLRHAAATFYRHAGCDPMVIQLMLGHSMNITDGTYTHISEEYMRTEINKLKLDSL